MLFWTTFQMGKLSQVSCGTLLESLPTPPQPRGGGREEACLPPPLFYMLSDLCVGAHGIMIYEQLNGVCVSLESNLGWAL